MWSCKALVYKREDDDSMTAEWFCSLYVSKSIEDMTGSAMLYKTIWFQLTALAYEKLAEVSQK